jgi:hypothetical protein
VVKDTSQLVREKVQKHQKENSLEESRLALASILIVGFSELVLVNFRAKQ